MTYLSDTGCLEIQGASLHNIPVSGHIPLPIILLISIFLSGLAICTAFWLAYDSDRFKKLSLPKQIILLVLYTAGFTFLILYDFM
ncbi:hypothetical protein [Escherichia coli]|uniref:hypothetical protein n=1 Tax=Escherichia coli TaxID=562 RepID=UPI001CDAD237|nr:hypothetical protein [Escherichia coli]